jgi:tetratricopeptide (TPR) repeat protein
MKYTKYILFIPKCSEMLRPKAVKPEHMGILNEADQLLDADLPHEAVTKYQTLANQIPKEKEQGLFAYIQCNLGLCYMKIALSSGGEVSLAKAIKALTEALHIYNQKDFPLEYAMVQNDLAAVFSSLAEYQDEGENIAKVISAGVTAHEVLENYLKSGNPKQQTREYVWAMTLSGIASNIMAEYREREANLERAVYCCQEALTAIEAKDSPSLYALLQFNQGYALDLYSEFIQPEQNRQQAITSYEAALEVYSGHSRYLLEYLHTKNCLANLYIDQAQANKEYECLNTAIRACQEALKVFAANQKYPLCYALLLHNLGSACKILAKTRNAEEYLGKSIHYFKDALEVESLSHYSEIRASTYLNIAIIHVELAEIRDRFDNLTIAIQFFEDALQIYGAESYPVRYRITQSNLGGAYLSLSTISAPKDNLCKAIQAFNAAVSNPDNLEQPAGIAKDRYNLGNAYLKLALLVDKIDNCTKAITNYEAALAIFTSENYPDEFALTENGLGKAYLLITENAPGDDCFIKSIQAFETAVKSCSASRYPLEYAEILINLALACQKYAKFRNREGNIGKALKNYRDALKILTLEKYPLEYAATSSKLAQALLEMAEINEKEQYLEMAVKALEDALKVFTLTESPGQFAETESKLGEVYLGLFETTTKSINIRKAFVAFDAALQYYTIDEWPREFAANSDKIGISYKLMAETADSYSFKDLAEYRQYQTEHLSNALKSFMSALQIFDAVNYPVEHAMIYVNIGKVYSFMANIQDKKGNAINAISAFQEALTVYNAEDYPADHRRVNAHIERVKQQL